MHTQTQDHTQSQVQVQPPGAPAAARPDPIISAIDQRLAELAQARALIACDLGEAAVRARTQPAPQAMRLTPRLGRPPRWSQISPLPGSGARHRRCVSPEGRAAIAAGQRRRWAKARLAARAEAARPSAETTAGALTAAAAVAAKETRSRARTRPANSITAAPAAAAAASSLRSRKAVL